MIFTLQTQSHKISWKTNLVFELCPSSVILTLKYSHLQLGKSWRMGAVTWPFDGQQVSSLRRRRVRIGFARPVHLCPGLIPDPSYRLRFPSSIEAT